jgi:hypothetical protein
MRRSKNGTPKANCWKVVSADMRSLAVSGDACLQYAVGEEVAAPVGGCLAFRRRRDAVLFLGTWPDERLFSAAGDEEVKLPARRADSAAGLEAFRAVWSRADGDGPFTWPFGTVAYRRLTLVEEAKP